MTKTFFCTGCGQVVTANTGGGCPNCPGVLGFGTHRRSTTDLAAVLAPAAPSNAPEPLSLDEREHIAMWIHANPKTAIASGFARLWAVHEGHGYDPRCVCPVCESRRAAPSEEPTPDSNAIEMPLVAAPRAVTAGTPDAEDLLDRYTKAVEDAWEGDDSNRDADAQRIALRAQILARLRSPEAEPCESTALMREVASELRYAATHQPWVPTPQVVAHCVALAAKLDAVAEDVFVQAASARDSVRWYDANLRGAESIMTAYSDALQAISRAAISDEGTSDPYAVLQRIDSEVWKALDGVGFRGDTLEAKDAGRWRKLVSLTDENQARKHLGAGVVLCASPANEFDAAWASIQALDHENPRGVVWMVERESLDEAIDAAHTPAARLRSPGDTPEAERASKASEILIAALRDIANGAEDFEQCWSVEVARGALELAGAALPSDSSPD